MRTAFVLSLLLVAPGWANAQQDPVQRLAEVLPPDKAEQIIAIVTTARAHGLPGQAVALRALEALAKGRNAEEAGAAARAFAGELSAAQGALRAGGRDPQAAEIEAGATAMAMGVDGKAVSELARSAPSGRSLDVPLLVIGALVERGLPADQALAAVLARLEARASNADLASLPGEAGRLIAAGHRPAEVGRALGATRSGIAIPQGPPASVPRNNGLPDPPRRPDTPRP
jgi:hypothetical protein